MKFLLNMADVIRTAKPLASLGISYAASCVVEEVLLAFAPQLADTLLKQVAFRVGVLGVGVATSQIVADAIEREADELSDSLIGLRGMILAAQIEKEAENGGASDEPEAVVSDSE